MVRMLENGCVIEAAYYLSFIKHETLKPLLKKIEI
jgi:hypothetical protein